MSEAESALLCFQTLSPELQLAPTQFGAMETGEKKTSEKSEARIPPKRGQVKVMVYQTLANGVKTAASATAKKVCGESSASIAPESDSKD